MVWLNISLTTMATKLACKIDISRGTPWVLAASHATCAFMFYYRQNFGELALSLADVARTSGKVAFVYNSPQR